MTLEKYWNEDKTNGALWGATLVAALLLVGGSFWPGWQLDSTAKTSLRDSTRSVYVKALAPVCADRFRKQPDLQTQVAALSAERSWERDSYLAKKDFFPKTGESDTDVAIGDACATMLSDLVK